MAASESKDTNDKASWPKSSAQVRAVLRQAHGETTRAFYWEANRVVVGDERTLCPQCSTGVFAYRPQKPTSPTVYMCSECVEAHRKYVTTESLEAYADAIDRHSADMEV